MSDPKQTERDPTIPAGMYCYTLKRDNSIDTIPESNKGYQPRFKIRLCKHWTKNEDGTVSCKVAGIVNHDKTDSLLWDMVKECGINNDDE